MAEAILVLNAGSSSLKFTVFEDRPGSDPVRITAGQVEGLSTAPHLIVRDAAGATLEERRWPDGVTLPHADAVAALIERGPTLLAGRNLAAVGHRVVHGGVEFAEPVRVDGAIVDRLEKLVPLAPLHQPHNLAPIRAIAARAPELPQIACFDTAFHRGQPPLAQAFALPAEITDAGVRRYGFHGLSYEYVAATLPTLDPALARAKVVVAHLGNGASLCAMRDGSSVASTMGLTALDGLPMGTRSGALDPGVLLWLMDERGMDARAIEALLYTRSGLLGVSGVSSDMRKLRESAEPRAKLAIDLFVYRIGREIGSLAAALGGLDALVFTAGIGENDAALREAVCRDASWLGIELDPAANAARGPRISRVDARVSAWVVATDEELMIARHVQSVLAGA